ncbi:hypothetical protein P692DRAFT_20819338 [Suillus brevipes Sb2]|nr:hypothetical protein P692DRAFT_20819338 [Suillus brevipes Sb2]
MGPTTHTICVTQWQFENLVSYSHMKHMILYLAKIHWHARTPIKVRLHNSNSSSLNYSMLLRVYNENTGLNTICQTKLQSGHMVQGVNIACAYLQDEQGVPISAQHTKTIWNLMLSSFQQLDTQGLAPDSISQAPLQWFNYHMKKRTGKHIKAEHRESSPDLMEDALPSVIQKQGNDKAIPDIPQHPSPECEPTPPPRPDKGKDKEATTIEIKNPLSNVVLKPTRCPLPFPTTL